MHEFDYIVVNDDFEHATAELEAIVTGQGETRKAEPLHQRDHGLSRAPLGMGPVFRIGRWTLAAPVARQVRHDEGEVSRQLRSHPMPDQMRLRITVQKQKRRPGAAAR